MTNLWIDIGVNLTDSSFDKDRDQVIEESFNHNISQMIITGTTLGESEQAIELAQQYPGQLFTTAGIHPHYCKDHSADAYPQILKLSAEKEVVAIGETGLDFNRNFSSPELQISSFEKHLEIAAETQLPLFLHERDAHKKQNEVLCYHRDHISQAVAHCFTGSKEALYNYLDLDLYIGITGWICDERRGKELQELITDIPLNRLLLETDAPYLIPRDLKPKPKSRRNLPLHLPHIASRVAELRGISTEELSHATVENSKTLFRI